MLRGELQGSPRRPFGTVEIRNYNLIGRVCFSTGGRGKPVSMNAKAASAFGAESADLAVHIGRSPLEQSLRSRMVPLEAASFRAGSISSSVR